MAGNITYIAGGSVTGLTVSQMLPGVEPPMILASLAGSFIFFAISNNFTVMKRVGLFITSFMTGLMFTNTADSIYNYHFHGISIDKPLWSFIISALVVTVIIALINLIRNDGVINSLFRRIFNIKKEDE